MLRKGIKATAFLLLLLVSSPAWAAIALVNQGSGGLGVTGSATSGTTVGVTLSQAAVAGDCLVAFASNNVAGKPTVSSISGGGVTWVVASESNTNTDDAIWYGVNSSGSGTSITTTFSGDLTGGTGRVTVVEFSGVATSSAQDGSGVSNNGSGTAISTGTLTPTGGLNEVILATYKGGNISTGPTNSFTALNTAGTAFQSAYLLVTSTSGSYSTSWTAASTSWDSEIASLKASASGTAQSDKIFHSGFEL